MPEMLGAIEIVRSSCDLSTIQDGRGGIFTFIPNVPILEFNMVYFNPAKIRGNHYHPEFVEYFLVVTGSVVMVTVDKETGEEVSHMAGPGTCFRTPPGTTHAVYALVESLCVAMLSKPWHECDNPILREDIFTGKPDGGAS